MALLQECPRCKTKLSLKSQVQGMEGGLSTKRIQEEKKVCPSCGFKLRKASGKAYWIEYYIDGRRKRERIGPNKQAAEQRLREVLKLRTEERYIDKDPAVRLTLGELCKWYLNLPEVKVKDSYQRDKDFIGHLKRILGEETKIKNITSGKIESYQKTRLAEPSPRHKGEKIKPATVNKEVICLKTIFNRAVRHGELQHNNIERVKKLVENNVRMKILTQEEFSNLINLCPPHVQPVVMMAYYMGMRKSEIINLTWQEVDLKKKFIRLAAERTKTDQARIVPIHPLVNKVLDALPKGIRKGVRIKRVFLKDGEPFDDFKHSFSTACKNAGLQDFTFHDLRHCALNNLRRSGNDFFEIMALSGHKTMSCFKRYNLVTEDELSMIKWPDGGEILGPMDTNMDTNEKKVTSESL
jgi:integrase